VTPVSRFYYCLRFQMPAVSPGGSAPKMPGGRALAAPRGSE